MTNPSDDAKTALENFAQIPPPHRQIHTFMKRRTHMSRHAQTALSDGSYQSYLVNHSGHIGNAGDFAAITNLRTLFTNPKAALTLEIGFGMGASLLEMAKNHPDVNFVGIEVHEPGIGNCAYQAHALGLSNLKLINGDAIALLAQLPDNHLDTVQLYFPDPWQKKRHYKRRFVSPERMNLVARALKPGGIFHAATDWEHYALWMLELLDSLPAWQNLSGQGQFAPRPKFRPLTKFERRALADGRSIWDLLYQKRTP